MRDTRPNNKRTLQSGQGLYWHTPDRSPAPATAKQLDTAPAPAPLACKCPKLPLARLFVGPGQQQESQAPSPPPARQPASATSLQRSFAADFGRATADPRRARLPATTRPCLPPSPVGLGASPLAGVGNSAGPAAGAAPKASCCAPEAAAGPFRVPACRASTVLLLLSTWGQLSPGRAGHARRPGRGCGAQRCPVPPPREAAGERMGGGAVKGAHTRSYRGERSKQTNKLTNKRVF